MKKFFGFGSSTPPPSQPPSGPPAPPAKPLAPEKPTTAPATSIVGKWREPQGKDTTEFHSDGTITEKPATGETIRGRYLFDGTHLKIHIDGVADELTFSAKIQNDTLEMTDRDGQSTRYQRAYLD